MKITPAFIYAIAPAAKPEYVDDIVRYQDMLTRYGITAVADVCHFLAQCAAETQGFNKLEESLYYTSTARLRAVWPSRFKSDAAAAPYVRQPEKLANFTYGGRLGNKLPGDGWNFRGSGCPHLTGRANYQGMQDRTGVKCVTVPDLIRAFPAALEAACDFWRANGLSRFVGDVTALTKRWQGGGNGALADRKTYTARALAAAGRIAMSPVSVPPALPKPIPASKLMRKGNPGNDLAQVKTLQTRLTQLGYDVGRIDGIFGDSTERGVSDFQRDNRLVADGVVGPATVKALNNAKGRAKVPPSAEPPSGLNQFLAWIISLFTRA